MSGAEDDRVDPNVALTEVRRLLARGRFEDLTPTDSHRLVDLVEGLDGWLAAGGFLPERWRERRVPPGTTGTDQSWWQVRPNELAWRYGCDADRLRDDINPEDLSEWQFDLVMAALAVCRERTARMRIPK